MIKKFALALTMSFISSVAFAANGVPEEPSQPEGMTSAHRETLAQAFKAEQAGHRMRGDAKTVYSKWNTTYRHVPLANMAPNELQKLAAGRYMITKDYGQWKEIWRVTYFDPNGEAKICSYTGTGKGTGKHWFHEFDYDWKVTYPPVGASGLLIVPEMKKVKDGSFTFGLVYMPETGEAFYEYGKRKEQFARGWFQDSAPEAAVNNCPNLPRVKVNTNQRLPQDASKPMSLQELAKGADTSRGAPVLFRNSIDNPATSQMFIWAYPYPK